MGGFDIKAFIKELEHTSKTELDFTNEARNLEQFRELNAGRACIESPKCYRELTNEAILTEDFVTGTEVGDIAYLDTLSEDERDRIAALVADNFATQILTDGFYHADPHSGNVLIKDLPPRTPSDEDEDEVTEQATEEAAEEAADADAGEPEVNPTELLEHSIEWIDFGTSCHDSRSACHDRLPDHGLRRLYRQPVLRWSAVQRHEEGQVALA